MSRLRTDWTNTMRKHGTISGYSLHKSLKEKPCEPCLLAKKTYDKSRPWRPHPNSEYRTLYQRLLAKAQHKSHSELRLAHKDEFDQLWKKNVKEILAASTEQLAALKRKER